MRQCLPALRGSRRLQRFATDQASECRARHPTVFDRYNIVNERDLLSAGQRLFEYVTRVQRNNKLPRPAATLPRLRGTLGPTPMQVDGKLPK